MFAHNRLLFDSAPANPPDQQMNQRINPRPAMKPTPPEDNFLSPDVVRPPNMDLQGPATASASGLPDVGDATGLDSPAMALDADVTVPKKITGMQKKINTTQ